MKVCVFLSDNPNCFTFGYDEENPKCLRLKLTLLQYIEFLHKNGVHYFVTDCEFGAGFWAAEIVAGLTTLHTNMWYGCIMPYEEQAARWSVEQRERYYSLLEKSQENRYFQKAYTEKCIEDCRHYLIENADIVLFIYRPGKAIAEIMQFVSKKNIPLICINPETSRRLQDFTI